MRDDENGKRKYSVQSFLLSPEEMTLLRPICTKAYSTNGDQSMDMEMNMLNHLSEAGIVVGSQVEVLSNVDVDVLLQNTINERAIGKFAEYMRLNNTKLPTNVLRCVFETIKTFIISVQKNPRHFFNITNQTLNNQNNKALDSIKMANDSTCTNDLSLIDIISHTVLDCVLHELKDNTLNTEDFYNNPLLYEIIGKCLMENLCQHCEYSDSLKIYEWFIRIEKLLSSPETTSQIRNSIKKLTAQNIKINKIDVIKAMINEVPVENETDILENIQTIMQNDAVNELYECLRSLIHQEPFLIQNVITEMQKQTKNLVNESSVVKILRNCIVSAVQKTTSDDIKHITNTPGHYSTEKINSYLTDTLSLARALGFTECILNLSNIINYDGDMIKKLKEDEKSYELFQRVIVMHKLSQNNEMRKKALESLRKDPYSSRGNINLRNLLRLSGICTINLIKENTVKDSNDIPISLIYSGNDLAIQDFFMRTQSRQSGPILIVKDCFEAVVPRESSRDVLTGKCAYNVLDENGIRHFEPLHMFTALKLKNVTMFEDRFSSYSAQNSINTDKVDNKCDIDSILNLSAIATASSNGFITYKSTNLPRKELCIAHRKSAHQINYRRSFYL